MEEFNVVMAHVVHRDSGTYLMLEKRRDHGHERYDRTPFETAGGKIEDESVEEAALRELREETGLDGEVVETGSIYTRKESELELVFRPVLVEVESREIELSDEHEGYCWLTRRGLKHVATETEVKAFKELL